MNHIIKALSLTLLLPFSCYAMTSPVYGPATQDGTPPMIATAGEENPCELSHLVDAANHEKTRSASPTQRAHCQEINPDILASMAIPAEEARLKAQLAQLDRVKAERRTAAQLELTRLEKERDAYIPAEQAILAAFARTCLAADEEAQAKKVAAEATRDQELLALVIKREKEDSEAKSLREKLAALAPEKTATATTPAPKKASGLFSWFRKAK